MSIQTLRENPFTIENKKLDLKCQCVVLNIKSKIYLLLDKGIFRKALEKLNPNKLSRFSLLNCISVQSLSFKFVRHSENAVNSLGYILEIANSRKKKAETTKSLGVFNDSNNSKGLQKEPTKQEDSSKLPENEDVLFDRLKTVLHQRILQKKQATTLKTTLNRIKFLNAQNETLFRDFEEYPAHLVNL